MGIELSHGPGKRMAEISSIASFPLWVADSVVNRFSSSQEEYAGANIYDTPDSIVSADTSPDTITATVDLVSNVDLRGLSLAAATIGIFAAGNSMKKRLEPGVDLLNRARVESMGLWLAATGLGAAGYIVGSDTKEGVVTLVSIVSMNCALHARGESDSDGKGHQSGPVRFEL